ncbi:DUF2637 domain-containing protein [Streptomyces sp. NBC_01476]|uniref:DUF2637 domain-containing protein n=1 Tax=Streptomyces sp. NBC_01476 TaxID=2903881 RepID=UPI002E307F9C|nr:DUF2637 domain-containing protein [Streptomyces sp. NBC_01476]
MAAIQLTRMHRILAGIVVTGAVVIAGIGFAGSYAAVRSLALDKGFGWFANVFPVGVDAGIVVLLALDLLLTWLRIPFPLLRQTAWLLTAATIAFNGAAAWPDPLGVGMHAIIPVLFVVSVEAARHAIGRIADITADKHMEGVRLTRWLLAPVPTFKLWRRMKLWELRSYEEVIRREQDRLVYRARLRARYGVAWRRRAPIEALMPLRLAKYGVPLSETADAGLEAAGIELSSPVRQLEAVKVEPVTPAAPADQVEQAPAAATGTAAPGARQPEAAAEPSHEQGYDPGFEEQQVYDQQRLYEQQMYEQQPSFEEWQGTHDSPWFAAPYAQAYPNQRPPQQQDPQQPQGPQQFEPEPQQQPQVMVPNGPYRQRPLGNPDINGTPNGAPNGVNGANGYNGNSAQEFREPPYAAQPQYQQPQYQQAQYQQPQYRQAAQSAAPAQPEPEPPAPGGDSDAETYPVAGLNLPDGIPASEAYFGAYRNHVLSTGERPNNARQLARILENEFGGTAPEQRELIGAIRELRTRFQSEQETEHIP